VLIAIQSALKNIKLRNEVRRTWGGSCVSTHSTWCSVMFVLGQLSNNTADPFQADLEAESAKHRDILQESFIDSYNNLTLKSIHILKYYVNSVSEEAGVNNFLLKTDDDSFVHLETLWDLAKARIAKKSDNLIGYLQRGLKKPDYLPMAHKPTRSNLSLYKKWIVPSYMYGRIFYPQFLSGSGYLVTRKAAGCLLEKSKVLKCKTKLKRFSDRFPTPAGSKM
jgi:beta-1,3-galactosyltransferase 1